MKLSLIAAMDRNRVIGKDGDMPWDLPADLRYFRSTTAGKPVVMGRRTFESIGRPLPKRRNIVISRQLKALPGCDVFDSLDTALDILKNTETAHDEIMIIGGATLYTQTLPQADRLYLTLIDAEFDGDTFFPAWSEADWQENFREPHAPDAENSHAYTFVHLDRINSDRINPDSASL